MLRQRKCAITLPSRAKPSASATNMGNNVTQEGKVDGLGDEYED